MEPEVYFIDFDVRWILTLTIIIVLAYCARQVNKPVIVINTILYRVSGRYILGFCTIFIILATVYINQVRLGGFPHVMDEVAYLFQAKIFARFQLKAKAPGLAEFFPFPWILIHEGYWSSIYPPGYSLFLVPTIWFGTPYLLNPILSVLCLILSYKIAKLLFSKLMACYVVLLYIISPFIIFMSSSYMSHVQSQFLCLSAYYSMLLYRYKKRSISYILFFSMATGFLFISRSFVATTFLFFPAVFILKEIFLRRNDRKIAHLLIFFIPLIFFLTCFLSYNHTITGNYFMLPWNLKYPGIKLGFGEDRGVDGWGGSGHSLRNGIENLVLNLRVLNSDLLGWPNLSVVLAFLSFPMGILNRDKRVIHLWLPILMVFLGYLGYFFPGICFGARFYYCLAPFFIILTVWVIKKLGEYFKSNLVNYAVLLVILWGFVEYDLMMYKLYGRNYFGVDPVYVETVEKSRLDNGLIFINIYSSMREYIVPFSKNSPFLDSNRIYAINRGKENNKLIAMYKDRKPYIIGLDEKSRKILIISLTNK